MEKPFFSDLQTKYVLLSNDDRHFTSQVFKCDAEYQQKLSRLWYYLDFRA